MDSGLKAYILVWTLAYIHTFFVQAGKALVRLSRCTGSSELSPPAFVISTEILCAGPNDVGYHWKVLDEDLNKNVRKGKLKKLYNIIYA